MASSKKTAVKDSTQLCSAGKVTFAPSAFAPGKPARVVEMRMKAFVGFQPAKIAVSEMVIADFRNAKKARSGICVSVKDAADIELIAASLDGKRPAVLFPPARAAGCGLNCATTPLLSLLDWAKVHAGDILTLKFRLLESVLSRVTPLCPCCGHRRLPKSYGEKPKRVTVQVFAALFGPKLT